MRRNFLVLPLCTLLLSCSESGDFALCEASNLQIHLNITENVASVGGDVLGVPVGCAGNAHCMTFPFAMSQPPSPSHNVWSDGGTDFQLLQRTGQAIIVRGSGPDGRVYDLHYSFENGLERLVTWSDAKKTTLTRCQGKLMFSDLASIRGRR